MIVALIPARGGSKRLARKNLKPFAGRPLIYYSIALAKTTKRIDRCIVSTEDAEIAQVALSYGAEVINRPPELADDFATTVSVAKHALEQLVKAGRQPDILVTLQPNCPLRPPSLVEKALELFTSSATDAVISVTMSNHKLGEIKGGYFVPMYQPGLRSQDLPKVYFENGLVYVSRAKLVLERGRLFGDRILPLVTETLYAMGDIDTELDFQIAEFLFKKYRDHFEYPALRPKDGRDADG